MNLIALITIVQKGKQGDEPVLPGEKFTVPDDEGTSLVKRGFAVLAPKTGDKEAPPAA